MPEWSMTIETLEWKQTLRGTGQPPTVSQTGPVIILPPLPPPVRPPEPPPYVPPPQPPVDQSPFAWPPAPGWVPDLPEERYYAIPADDYGVLNVYAGETNVPNPSPGSHRFAGRFPLGVRTSYGRDIGGLNAWAPAGISGPVLRRIMAEGR